MLPPLKVRNESLPPELIKTARKFIQFKNKVGISFTQTKINFSRDISHILSRQKNANDSRTMGIIRPTIDDNVLDKYFDNIYKNKNASTNIRQIEQSIDKLENYAKCAPKDVSFTDILNETPTDATKRKMCAPFMSLSKPPGRKEAELLASWIERKLEDCNAEQAKQVYEFSLLELIRQTFVNCHERGALLKHIVANVKESYKKEVESLQARLISENADMRLQILSKEDQIKLEKVYNKDVEGKFTTQCSKLDVLEKENIKLKEANAAIQKKNNELDQQCTILDIYVKKLQKQLQTKEEMAGSQVNVRHAYANESKNFQNGMQQLRTVLKETIQDNRSQNNIDTKLKRKNSPGVLWFELPKKRIVRRQMLVLTKANSSANLCGGADKGVQTDNAAICKSSIPFKKSLSLPSMSQMINADNKTINLNKTFTKLPEEVSNLNKTEEIEYLKRKVLGLEKQLMMLLIENSIPKSTNISIDYKTLGSLDAPKHGEAKDDSISDIADIQGEARKLTEAEKILASTLTKYEKRKERYLKDAMPLHPMLKAITSIYNNIISANQKTLRKIANPFHLKLPFIDYAQLYLLSKYGNKNFANSKLIQLIKSVIAHQKLLRVGIFNGFLGIGTKEHADSISFYIKMLGFATYSQMGVNVPNKDDSDILLFPYVRAAEFMKQYFEYSTPKNEYHELCLNIDKIKELDPKKINRTGLINIDRLFAIMEVQYKSSVTKIKSSVKELFYGTNINDDKKIGMVELDMMFKSIEPENYSKKVVEEIFATYANGDELSFNDFVAMCQEKKLFNESQQLKLIKFSKEEDLYKCVRSLYDEFDKVSKIILLRTQSEYADMLEQLKKKCKIEGTKQAKSVWISYRIIEECSKMSYSDSQVSLYMGCWNELI